MSDKKAKHPGGRPRKYDDPEVMQKRINSYFKKCDDHTEKKLVFEGVQNGSTIQTVPFPIPYSVAGLCSHLEITRDTLLEYQKLPEFSDSITNAKIRIESNTVERGLSGTNNPTVTNFILRNCHGYSERQEVEHSGTIVQERVIKGLTKEQAAELLADE